MNMRKISTNMQCFLLAVVSVGLFFFQGYEGIRADGATLVELGSDVYTSNTYSVTGNVPATSTVITPTVASRHMIIKTDPSAAILYVRLDGGTVTSANFRIDPGASLSLDGLPLLPKISILGASAAGTYSVLAW